MRFLVNAIAFFGTVIVAATAPWPVTLIVVACVAGYFAWTLPLNGGARIRRRAGTDFVRAATIYWSNAIRCEKAHRETRLDDFANVLRWSIARALVEGRGTCEIGCFQEGEQHGPCPVITYAAVVSGLAFTQDELRSFMPWTRMRITADSISVRHQSEENWTTILSRGQKPEKLYAVGHQRTCACGKYNQHIAASLRSLSKVQKPRHVQEFANPRVWDAPLT